MATTTPEPKWHDMLPHLVTATTYGPAEQKKAAMDELYKLADFADASIDAPPPDEAEAPRPEQSEPPPVQHS